MPAVTLTKSMIQRSQNCGVFQASWTATLCVGDQRRVVGRRHPAFGLPAFRRDADGEDAEHHEEEVENAHRDHGVGNRGMACSLEVGHQLVGQRTADHGAAAEAHDGKAGGKTGAVREPLDERGDRRDVAETEPDAADDAVAEVDERKLMAAGAKRSDDEAEAEAYGRVEHGAARSGLLQPCSEERGRETQDGDGDGEDVTDLFQVPRRAVGAMQRKQGVLEDGEGVDLADRKMDGKGSRGNQPAAVSGWSNRAVTIKKSQGHIFENLGRF